ncbi:MAG: transglutaminase domain-containing protein, partial [Tangfeifania sp.]
MMKRILWLVIAFTAVLYSCQSEYSGVPEKYHSLLDSAFVKAGENEEEHKLALEQSEKNQKEATAFLISYMPEKDLKTLSAGFILDQVQGAWRAREEFEWCRNLPDSIFLNEVLPYYNLDEDRDNWRDDFY